MATVPACWLAKTRFNHGVQLVQLHVSINHNKYSWGFGIVYQNTNPFKKILNSLLPYFLRFVFNNFSLQWQRGFYQGKVSRHVPDRLCRNNTMASTTQLIQKLKSLNNLNKFTFLFTSNNFILFQTKRGLRCTTWQLRQICLRKLPCYPRQCHSSNAPPISWTTIDAAMYRSNNNVAKLTTFKSVPINKQLTV
jgi:hypothetical protein